jgi:hypothetical protein
VPLLVVKDSPSYVRHFGLGILENGIKNCWTSYSDTEKDQVKKFAMELVVHVI